jgi:hypothetical protein
LVYVAASTDGYVVGEESEAQNSQYRKEQLVIVSVEWSQPTEQLGKLDSFDVQQRDVRTPPFPAVHLLS